MSDIKAERRYSDPTKSDYIIRCMAAENTVRQQDKSLTAETQARAKFELAANRLQDEVDRLRRQRLTERILFVGIIAGMIAGTWFLIGGAQ
jgi:hypothetical protein